LQSITEQDVRLQPLWHEDNGQRQTVQERYSFTLTRLHVV
jgi:hypothetical protein